MEQTDVSVSLVAGTGPMYAVVQRVSALLSAIEIGHELLVMSPAQRERYLGYIATAEKRGIQAIVVCSGHDRLLAREMRERTAVPVIEMEDLTGWVGDDLEAAVELAARRVAGILDEPRPCYRDRLADVLQMERLQPEFAAAERVPALLES